MRTSNALLSTSAAFVGGFVAGYLYQSERCKSLRLKVAHKTQVQTQWLQHRIHVVEAQIHDLEASIAEARASLGERVRSVRDQAVGHYVPDLSDGDENWELEREGIEKDLRLRRR